MTTFPMKKLLIIHGIHLENIITLSTSEEKVIELIHEKSFDLVASLKDQNVYVYKSDLYLDYSKQTHIIINLGDMVSELRHYTDKL